VQERAWGPPCQVWWGSYFTHRRGGQKHWVFCVFVCPSGMGMCCEKKTMIGWRNVWSMTWMVPDQEVNERKLRQRLYKKTARHVNSTGRIPWRKQMKLWFWKFKIKKCVYFCVEWAYSHIRPSLWCLLMTSWFVLTVWKFATWITGYRHLQWVQMSSLFRFLLQVTLFHDLLSPSCLYHCVYNWITRRNSL